MEFISGVHHTPMRGSYGITHSRRIKTYSNSVEALKDVTLTIPVEIKRQGSGKPLQARDLGSSASYDVIIAGASFAGIACAKALAQRGCSVLVLERKADPGTGIRTTGILVHEAADLLELPVELYKPISQVRLYGPSMRHIELASSRYFFLATDTPMLMRYLVQDAAKSGVEFMLDTAFTHGEETGDRIIVNHGLASCRLLIGADGARSRVAAMFGLGKNRRFLLGVEAEYTGLTIDNPEAFYCFLDQRYAPGYIGWVIPGPKVMQVGPCHAPHAKTRYCCLHPPYCANLARPAAPDRRAARRADPRW